MGLLRIFQGIFLGWIVDKNSLETNYIALNCIYNFITAISSNISAKFVFIPFATSPRPWQIPANEMQGCQKLSFSGSVDLFFLAYK